MKAVSWLRLSRAGGQVAGVGAGVGVQVVEVDVDAFGEPHPHEGEALGGQAVAGVGLQEFQRTRSKSSVS